MYSTNNYLIIIFKIPFTFFIVGNLFVAYGHGRKGFDSLMLMAFNMFWTKCVHLCTWPVMKHWEQ